jgi:hypothetical protein
MIANMLSFLSLALRLPFLSSGAKMVATRTVEATSTMKVTNATGAMGTVQAPESLHLSNHSFLPERSHGSPPDDIEESTPERPFGQSFHR